MLGSLGKYFENIKVDFKMDPKQESGTQDEEVIDDDKSQNSESQKSGSTAKIENIDEKNIYQELKKIKE